MVTKDCILLVLVLQSIALICPITANDNDDLMDFDFETVTSKAPPPSNVSQSEQEPVVVAEAFDSAFDEFLDIIVDPVPVSPGAHIQQKETRVKNKLVRAWKNPKMQRKFAEVLPILKVMTSEQKIALAALVSAQVGSKQGRELNLNEVR